MALGLTIIMDLGVAVLGNARFPPAATLIDGFVS
jgi:hypothetical protein